MHNFDTLLREHQLKVTPPRLSVLEVVSADEAATSLSKLEQQLKGLDRITLYRTLKTFEEKGILHRVMDLNGVANYAMCSPACSSGHHHDEHFHFNCTNCKKLYCMNDFHFPPFQMPSGFKAEAVSLLISGTCANCNTVIAQ